MAELRPVSGQSTRARTSTHISTQKAIDQPHFDITAGLSNPSNPLEKPLVNMPYVMSIECPHIMALSSHAYGSSSTVPKPCERACCRQCDKGQRLVGGPFTASKAAYRKSRGGRRLSRQRTKRVGGAVQHTSMMLSVCSIV